MKILHSLLRLGFVFLFTYNLGLAQPFTYNFNGDLSEGSGLGQALTTVGSGTGSFVNDPLLSNDIVYEFTADAGLTFDLDAAGIDLNQDYTIELFFRFENYQRSWAKIIDYKNRSSDNGLYDYLRRIQFWPYTAGGQQFVEGEYSYLAVTRDGASKEYIVYDNSGIAILALTDDLDRGVQNSSNVLHFFLDDFVTGKGETCTGAVRKIRIHGELLGPEDILENAANFVKIDSDNDGILDENDNCPNTYNQDQLDTDGDLVGDACDEDDDGDGVNDVDDADPLNKFICQDIDADGCDDCASGIVDPTNDGLDTDGDGLCNVGDPDDDNDGCLDEEDDNPLVTSTDYDGDGDANDCDLDDDGDGVNDVDDADPLNEFVCQDVDADGCDDCASGIVDPTNDGLDTDGDGLCNVGDSDDDGDGFGDDCDLEPLNNNFDLVPLSEVPASWICHPNEHKIYICHNGMTLCVSYNAAQAHLDQGDYLGECNTCEESEIEGIAQQSSNNNLELNHRNSNQIQINDFALVPNPTKDVVSIQLANQATSTQIFIYNNLGQVVWSQEVNPYTITVEVDLSAAKYLTGIYTVTMTNGDQTISKRLILAK